MIKSGGNSVRLLPVAAEAVVGPEAISRERKFFDRLLIRHRFINASRKRTFWGYDRSMENSFFVTWEALKHIQPTLQPDETGFLRAFDSNRKLIYDIATKVYARGRKSVYNLVVADF